MKGWSSASWDLSPYTSFAKLCQAAGLETSGAVVEGRANKHV